MQSPLVLSEHMFPEATRVPGGVRSQPENHTAVRTDDGFGVFAVPSEIFEVASASHRFHHREHHHHQLGAYSLALRIHGAAVGAGVPVAYLLSVPAVIFRVVSAQVANYLDVEPVFLIVPFFHINTSMLLYYNTIRNACQRKNPTPLPEWDSFVKLLFSDRCDYLSAA